MNNSEERQIVLRLARGRVKLRDVRCPECSIVYNNVIKHFESGHPELTAKRVKTHIRELQLMVSVDQLKKLRAQNPPVPMVSHLDDPEEGEERQGTLLPQTPEDCFQLPEPTGFFDGSEPEPAAASASSASPSTSAAGPTAPPRRRAQRRPRKQLLEIKPQLLEALRTRPAAPAPPPRSEDELFLLSLVPSLQRLPPQTKEFVKFQIHKLIYESSSA
ncbi:uncharacterized protein [Garra rufa]|uniref:uncharacterized protein n=1 Tax=Garra rufa TaxID=137080 RepID=UPI003CCEC53C